MIGPIRQPLLQSLQRRQRNSRGLRKQTAGSVRYGIQALAAEGGPGQSDKDAAAVIVRVPAGAAIERKGGKLMADGVVVDYRAKQES